MRARQRHFKYRSIGPRAAYDARYISGLSDGAAVSSWSDLSGNGFTATQATTARQPTYKAATIGGSASVRFGGAVGVALTHSITNNSTHSSFVVLNRLAAQTGDRGLFSIGLSGATGNTVLLLQSSAQNKYCIYSSNYNYANTTVALSSPCILTFDDNASSGGSFYFRGGADGTWTGDTLSQGQNHIGGYYTASPLVDQGSNIDIGALVMTSSLVSGPLRRRIQNSLAHAFKIACS